MRSNHFSGLKFPGRLYSPIVSTNVLRILWILLVCWGEIGVYFWSLSTCRWPTHNSPGEALHVLLISDTQISMSSPSPSPSSSHSSGFLTDIFLKKSWRMTSWLDPHIVFFLGDMLSNGKFVENEAQYAELVQRFKSTFPLNTSTPVYHLPGNNDVGMGLFSSSSRSTRAYYQKYFSPLNTIVSLKNHTFLALDAPALVDEDYQRNAGGASFDGWNPTPGGAVEVIRDIATQNYHPLILLSHIPLYRPDGASCGPRRESGTINRGVGHGYQNTLGKQTTAFLMQSLQPSAVFSGDNHDYCEYLHKGTSFGVAGSIPEITVKSFSPASHIRRPGFQLLSVIDPTNLESSQRPQSLLHRPCLLPDQTIIFTGYAWWTAATLSILLVLNIRRIRQFRLTGSIGSSITLSTTGNYHTSPFLQDINDTRSLVWSPHMPSPPIPPKSPRSQMPSTFRTPVAPETPTFRALSRPMTPQGFSGSPMFSPQLIPPAHDEEDSMFPDQYTIQRDVRRVHDEEWSPLGGEDYFEYPSQSANGTPANVDGLHGFPSPSQFISAPRSEPTDHRKQSAWKILWSKAFVLGGRRRVFLLRFPRLSAWWTGFAELLEVLRDVDQGTLLRRRRGIFASTLIEGFSVFWPAAVVWWVINCWMF